MLKGEKLALTNDSYVELGLSLTGTQKCGVARNLPQ